MVHGGEYVRSKTFGDEGVARCLRDFHGEARVAIGSEWGGVDGICQVTRCLTMSYASLYRI